MSWYLSPALVTLQGEVNAVYPHRSKVSDGTLGDAAHAARTSDHNPAADGEVCAWDCTYDPATGLGVAPELAEFLRTSKDLRVKYVIWNKRIFRSYPKPGIPAWTWAPYTGLNTHEHHCHVSVKTDSSGTAWGFHAPSPAKPAWTPPPMPTDLPLEYGESSDSVQMVKVLLKTIGYPGLWTWSKKFGDGMLSAVKAEQVKYWMNEGLSYPQALTRATGVVGERTVQWLFDTITVLKAQGKA